MHHLKITIDGDLRLPEELATRGSLYPMYPSPTPHAEVVINGSTYQVALPVGYTWNMAGLAAFIVMTAFSIRETLGDRR